MISASSLKIHIYIAMLILALCFPREAKGSSDKKGKELFNVLVIQSYNQSLSAYSKFDKLLHEELEKEQIYSSIHTFYLDCERYNATDEEARMYSFLDTLSFKPDIIISNDDQATYTLMACNHPLGKDDSGCLFRCQLSQLGNYWNSIPTSRVIGTSLNI